MVDDTELNSGLLSINMVSSPGNISLFKWAIVFSYSKSAAERMPRSRYLAWKAVMDGSMPWPVTSPMTAAMLNTELMRDSGDALGLTMLLCLIGLASLKLREPESFANTFLGYDLLAQRLVRRLCPLCVQPAGDGQFHDHYLQSIGFPLQHREAIQTAHGCRECRGTGYRGRMALIEVCDNGRGFDPGKTQHGSHGIQGMRFRLEAADGRLHIQSQAGAGTRVQAWLPLSVSSDTPAS